MKKILEQLATHCAFLYEDFGFRITDSKYDPAFGGGGSVTLENEIVELRLWLERDRVFLDLRGRGRRRPQSWFSLDILKELVTGTTVDDAALNAENMEFLKDHLSQVLHLFSSANLGRTESKCRELEKRRTARMFG